MPGYKKLLLNLFIASLLICFHTSCKKEEIKRIIKVTTDEVTQLKTKSATVNGTIIDIGEGITEHGFCWSTTNNPTIELSTKTQLGLKNSKGSFTGNLTNLTPNTTYYVRSYASDGETIKYGNEKSFKTESQTLATVVTGTVSDITINSAQVTATLSDLGNGIETILQHGHCWSTNQNPTTGNNKTQLGSRSTTGSFSSNLTGLSPVTTYYVRAYATNSVGTAYGNEISFQTNQSLTLPTLTTTPVSNITENSAQSGGNVTDDGGTTVTARGVCWSTSQNPTISDSYTSDGSGTGSFSSSITGLDQNTTYYVRAYAINSVGIAYGEQVSFTPLSTVTDYDGNVYPTVTIGTQTWMAENLKTTKYNDGTAIPLVTNSTEWSNLTTPGYCWYNNDEASYKNTYGALYNWYTVNTEKLCPTGWHVPTDSEWVTLTDYLGGISVAGGKLKETGTTHWKNPNTGATNESGFTALPGGYRSNDGAFDDVGYYGSWWSSTEYSTTNAYSRRLYYNYAYFYRLYYNKKLGYSVRCVRD